ncbi:RHS repeat-associated protein [Luteococcus japonicus]|uniref:RHS repeat-associated protein n=1 Tax=Luteococcus japonicus TaxID=33984 RepID=A0A3N1ZR81_9ACTN|nr:RHS repeat-associated protein [Luteococcus japonicus]
MVACALLALPLEELPGGIIRRHSYDSAGELVDLTYSGKGTDPETGTAVADQQWFGWSSRSDAAGRTVREWSTDGGSAYTTTEGTQAVSSDRRYGYDKAGRLTRVDETLNTRTEAPSCTRRGYGFDVNGNRTSQTVASNLSDCADTGAATVTRAYNEADHPVTGANGQGAYVYDPLGRQTSIPAADTIKPSNGAMSLAYYDSDAAQSVAQGDTKVTFTLDGAGRRLVQNTTVGPVVTPDVVAGTVTRHYTDSSDNPAWTVDVRGGQQVTTRFAGLTGDGMGITFTTINGVTTAELALAGLRGDVNATVKLDGANPATGIDTWADYTEYGQPTTAKTATVGGAAGVGYGWLGAHERATLDALGITLMGARLYNQATGLFTSLDPEYQGGDTAYGYPTDPVNNQDLAGTKWRSWWHRNGGTVLGYASAGACIFGGPAVCGALTVASASVSIYGRYRRYRRERRSVRSWRFVASTAWDVAGAKISPVRGIRATRFVATRHGIRRASRLRMHLGTTAGRWNSRAGYRHIHRTQPRKFWGRYLYNGFSAFKNFAGW